MLAIPAQKLNIAFLVALAFAVAASANLPSLLYNLFWRRFNTRGADVGDLRRPDHLRRCWCSSPRSCPARASTRSPARPSLFPTGIDFSWFPLENPGIISIPLGFLFGWLGTVTSREPEAEERVHRARGPLPHRRRARRRRSIH